MRPGSLDDRLQELAERAGVPYIDGKKVTSHGWRAGANTDMIAAGVSLAERNRAGRWAPGTHTADTVYDRRHDAGAHDPLARCRCTADRRTQRWPWRAPRRRQCVRRRRLRRDSLLDLFV
ncbi:site-specific integrase [Streptomyces goshikiensis]|uniref:hypothetical protein n=1 Tax=Streptomyces goshikiensis TaxID=1942 RepID=UPI0036BBCBDD